MQWYYSKNGTQLGPVEEVELRAKLASGEISAADLVWKDGMPDWLAASRVAELAPLTTLPSVNPPMAGGVQNSPYSPPVSQMPAPYRGPDFPNYLWQSIVVTVLCCWPFGIPAIVYAAKVDGLKARGDVAGAMSASASAKTWCMVAVGSWLALIVMWLLFVGIASISGQ